MAVAKTANEETTEAALLALGVVGETARVAETTGSQMQALLDLSFKLMKAKATT